MSRRGRPIRPGLGLNKSSNDKKVLDRVGFVFPASSVEIERSRKSPRMETTNAILLRKRKLSDTSLIISWCTESLGCVETVAKGARRPKSVFAGRLDLF